MRNCCSTTSRRIFFDVSDGSLDEFSLMELYRMESETQTAVLSEGLLELETNPSSIDRMEELMRAAHSLKGAARIVNLEPAVKIAHKMEDRFVEVQESRLTLQSRDVDILLASLDLLIQIGHWEESEIEKESKAHAKSLQDILDRLDTLGETEPAPPLDAPAEDAAPPEESPIRLDESTHGTDANPTEPSPEPSVPALTANESTVPTPQPSSAQTESTTNPKNKSKSVVRVGAENLSRLMELAAESLVESRQLAPSADRLVHLRSVHLGLESTLTTIKNALADVPSTETASVALQEAQHQSSKARQQLESFLTTFDDYLRRNGRLADHLYQETLQSRMRPFGEGTTAYPRLVRDLAKSLGKKVSLVLEGKKTGVDRDILEKLDAPLNHILRNALDHGFETPAERVAKGKPETGTLTLEAAHHAGMLRITIADDGRGVDRERLRSKVIEKGLASAEIATQLSDTELLEFLFLPAFSTTDKVTEISGRGVGLDVVQALMQELGGTVRIESTFGTGTRFLLQLPVTRSVIRALIVDIAGESYAAPLSAVDRICQVSSKDLAEIEGHQYLKHDGANIGLVDARDILELDGPSIDKDVISILVVSNQEHQYGLEVDRFLGERELVVRPLDSRLGKIPDIAAAAVSEDGAPLLILDIDDLIRSIDNRLRGHGPALGRSRRVREPDQGKVKKRILVADDSITVRQVQKQLLEGAGYEVHLAVDGMEAWNAARLGEFDLIVTDVDMPRMTGIEFVHRLRQEPHLSSLPVIIVSYKDREQDRLAGLEVGANLYLTKSSFQDESYLNGVLDLIGEATE